MTFDYKVFYTIDGNTFEDSRISYEPSDEIIIKRVIKYFNDAKEDLFYIVDDFIESEYLEEHILNHEKFNGSIEELIKSEIKSWNIFFKKLSSWDVEYDFIHYLEEYHKSEIEHLFEFDALLSIVVGVE